MNAYLQTLTITNNYAALVFALAVGILLLYRYEQRATLNDTVNRRALLSVRALDYGVYASIVIFLILSVL